MIEYIINMQNAAVGYTLLLLLMLITLSEVPQSSRQCWYLHKSYYAAESCDKIPGIALSSFTMRLIQKQISNWKLVL